MTEPITRVTLFVPGTPDTKRAWSQALGAPALPAQWVENDTRFGEAFSFGTVAKDVIARIDRAPGALVIHWPVDLRDGRRQIVAAGERLRDAGALAVRIEQSKVGWEISRWLELFTAEDPWAWHRGAVAFLRDREALQSCGMHAFSLPDVHVTIDGDAPQVQHLASAFDVYQLAEDPLLLSGQTFSPDPDTPRRVLERWPDTRYPRNHACHNPYGVWRLGPPGGVARPTRELVPVFVPTLHSILAALEKKAPKPLTKEQVESTRDQAPCIAMEPRDVQKLERSRGHADLDPALVWEQWQLVRKHG